MVVTSPPTEWARNSPSSRKKRGRCQPRTRNPRRWSPAEASTCFAAPEGEPAPTWFLAKGAVRGVDHPEQEG